MKIEKNEYGKIVYLEFKPGEHLGDGEASKLIEQLSEQGLGEVVEQFGLKTVAVEGWVVPPAVELNFRKKSLTVYEHGATIPRDILVKLKEYGEVAGFVRAKGFESVRFEGMLTGRPDKFRIEKILFGEFEVHVPDEKILSPKKTDPVVKELRAMFPGFKVEKKKTSV